MKEGGMEMYRYFQEVGRINCSKATASYTCSIDNLRMMEDTRERLQTWYTRVDAYVEQISLSDFAYSSALMPKVSNFLIGNVNWKRNPLTMTCWNQSQGQMPKQGLEPLTIRLSLMLYRLGLVVHRLQLHSFRSEAAAPRPAVLSSKPSIDTIRKCWLHWDISCPLGP